MAKFGQAFISGMLQPSFSKSLGSAAQSQAAAPGIRRAAEDRANAIAQMTQAAASQDPAQMLQVAQQLAKIPGMETQALQLAQMAQKVTQNVAAKQALVNRQEALATMAEGMGLPEVAANVRATTDEESLRGIAKDLRAQQIKKLPTQTPAVRMSLSKAAGITPQQFKQMGLDKVSDTEFDAVIGGQKGNIEPWMDSTGNIKGYRVNEFGNVYSEESQSWVSPASLDLQQAPPQVQRVEQVASQMGAELAKVGAKNFTDLQDKAVKAEETIRSIDQSLPKVDQMFSGALAEVKLNVSRYAKAFGADLSSLDGITDTETYAAMAATRVADYITNLGSGTGLSDADLKFSKQVVGADITADASSLKYLLEQLRKGAVNKINKYNQVREDVRAGLGEGQGGVLTFFPAIKVPEMTTGGSDFETLWGSQ